MKGVQAIVKWSLLVMLLIGGNMFAQGEPTANYDPNTKREKIEKETKEVLDKIMKYAEGYNYGAFGKLMVYSGKNPNRTMRTMMNPMDPHEKLEIENTLNFIHHWLDRSALYHAKEFKIVKGMKSDLYYWDVEFTSLKGKAKMFTVSFAELDGKYVFIRMIKKRN